MLISQKDFVEVHRNRDFIVGKIPQPGSFRLDCVGQQREDFCQRNRYTILVVRGVGNADAAGVTVWTVVNAEMVCVHDTESCVDRGAPTLFASSCIGRRHLAGLIYLEENAVFARQLCWRDGNRRTGVLQGSGSSGSLG